MPPDNHAAGRPSRLAVVFSLGFAGNRLVTDEHTLTVVKTMIHQVELKGLNFRCANIVVVV